MNEILILTNYFPPEKGAAANRIAQLAQNLNHLNYQVTVICPMGNYPNGRIFEQYKGKFIVHETINDIKTKRLWIYPSNSKNIVKRLLSVVSFASFLGFYLLFFKTPKKVIVQSPPLLLSFLTIIILKFKQKKIILNVSDLWPLAALELQLIAKNSVSHQMACYFEKNIYQKSTVILGQSLEILEHIQNLGHPQPCYLYRNYPVYDKAVFNLKCHTDGTIRIFYAGLLGVAQGIFELCKQIHLKNLPIEFHIFGEGAERQAIEALIETNGMANKLVFHGMLDRALLHQQLQTMDIAVVPLKNRIYGSVPSKIFEYSLLGFPILYFGGGEGEQIVAQNNLGWVAKVTDFEDFNNVLKNISLLTKVEIDQKKRQVFEQANQQFDLQKQMDNLVAFDVF